MDTIINKYNGEIGVISLDAIRYKVMVLLGIIILVWMIQVLWSRRKLYIYSWNIPGPLAFPIIGNTYFFVIYFFRRKEITGLFEAIHNEINKYEGIYRLWLGPKLFVTVTKPEYIEKVLTSPRALEKDDAYQFLLKDLLGNGIFTAPVSIWKIHRKAMAPCMGQNILNSYVQAFSEVSLQFVKRLNGVLGRKDVDWNILTTRYTLEAFGKTGLGVEMNILHSEPSDEDIGMCLREYSEILTYRYSILPYHFNAIWALAPIKKKFDKYVKLYDQITSSYINKKTQKYKQETDLKIKDKRKLDFLDLLLQNPNFTKEEVVDEVKTMIAGATDSSGITICTVFMMLGMHPDIQEKVYEEVIEVLGHHRAVEVSDLPLLKYTERVIKETLRLFPPAITFWRKVTGDLDLGKVTIPKGSGVFLVPSVVHRCPENWKDPLKFDPDRFLPEEVESRHPCTYIPFSYGPRNCIGWQYALMNIKTLTATVIRELQVFTDYKSVEEIKMKLTPILSFEDGVKLWFGHRTPPN